MPEDDETPSGSSSFPAETQAPAVWVKIAVPCLVLVGILAGGVIFYVLREPAGSRLVMRPTLEAHAQKTL